MIAAPALAMLLASGLYDQSVATLLRQRFPAASFLLLDVKSGDVIARKWQQAEKPLPIGSLVKPLLALSVEQAPVRRCDGRECWLTAGHGELDLPSAIANSCNSYFLALARQSDRTRLAHRLHELGVGAPHASASPETLIGLGRHWLVSPLNLARSYIRILARRDAAAVIAGMRQSARTGTARLIGQDALAKTATAACAHFAQGAGDGYVAAFYPSEAPRYLLVVQIHGTTGSQAARVTGRMLEVIRSGK